MKRKVLIIGRHPISVDLAKQCRNRGDDVVCLANINEITETYLNLFREAFLLSDLYKSQVEADNEIMGVLQQIAMNYILERHDGKRLLCHLLLRSNALLQIIRMEGLRKDVEAKLEVNPFTIEDQWSQAIAFSLDREPITLQSEKNVHLVIFGMTEIAEQVAINAAHVCHFPNYIVNNHVKRTRITVIDDNACEKSQEWIQRYEHLFENCYYRFVDPQKTPSVIHTSKPKYQNREDFIDVEWEFVSATPYDSLLRNKISEWAMSQFQLLCVVFTNSNSERGLDNALHLPEEVVSFGTPVWVYMESDEAFCQIHHSSLTSHIVPYGMVDRGYDVNIPIVKMAKNVNYIYDRCYEENDRDWNGRLRFSVEIDEDEKERSWMKKSGVKRMSNIYNAMTIGVKMRSIGLEEEDWDKFFDLSREEIEILAEVEHNRWCVEELILGWRPCDDAEQREIEADISKKEVYKKQKIHYDLRAYNDLRPDGTGKPVQVYDRCLSACIPLIAKVSREEDVK